jgi:hypothetical protein
MKSSTKHLPSAPPGDNGAEPAPPSLPATPAPSPSPGASPSPAERAPAVRIIVTGARVALGIQREAGGFLLSDERGQTTDGIIADVPLGAGVDLRKKLHEAADMVVDGLEALRAGAG